MEFGLELNIKRKGKGKLIIYDVMKGKSRKGLLVLEHPYNEQKPKKKLTIT